MRILVTGGAGFIGKNLCEYLLKRGHTVYCLDCKSKEQDVFILSLFSYPRFKYVQHNIIEPIQVEVDQIYHLACPASPCQYQKQPIETFQTIIWGTKNVLDLATLFNIPVLQASTSEIYGEPLYHPQSEQDWGNVNPIGIRSCYNEAKRAAESLCMDYFRVHGAPVKIIRIFNTYGPHMDAFDGRVVPNFIRQALLNKPLLVYGKGIQTRSFQYIEDLLRGMELLMNHPKSIVGPINFGNPNESTILSLAQTIIDLIGSSSTIEYAALPLDDPTKRKPDISFAFQQLTWKPIVSLHEGLKKTIDYFVDHFKHQKDLDHLLFLKKSSFSETKYAESPLD